MQYAGGKSIARTDPVNNPGNSDLIRLHMAVARVDSRRKLVAIGIVDVACSGRHQLQAREGGEGGFGGGAAAIITAAGKITAEQQGDILMIAEQYVGMGDQAAQYVLRVAVPSGPQLGAIIAVERDGHAQIGRRPRRRQC